MTRTSALLVALALGAFGAFARPASTGDATSPAEPEYAGRPVSWWITQLDDPKTVDVAKAALRVIGPPAVGPLVSALVSESSARRRAAAETLDAVPGDPGEVFAVLGPAFADPDDRVRLAAVRVAARIGERAAPFVGALAGRLADPDRHVRSEVLSVIAGLSPAAARDAAPALAEVGLSTSSDLRERALVALAKLGPFGAAALPRLIAALDASLTTESGSTVAALAKAVALAGPGDERVIEALRSARNVSTHKVRALLAETYAEHARGDPAGTAELLAVMRDRHPTVRLAAYRALNPGEPLVRDLVSTIVEAVVDEDPAVRAAAVTLLTPLGDEGARHLPRLLPLHEGAADRSALPMLLASWRHVVGPSLAAAYAGAGPIGRQLLSDGLARGGPSGAPVTDPAFRRALAEDVVSPGTNPAVRIKAMALLAWATQGDPATAAPLVSALDTDDEAVAAAAAAHLGGVPGSRAALVGALWHERAVVRRRALALLLRAELEPAERAAVGRLVDDPDPRVRHAAAIGVLRGATPFAADVRSGGRAFTLPIRPSMLARVLAEALDDEDVKTRFDAARCLGTLEEVAVEWLPRLVARLADADRGVVRSAAEASLRVANVGGVDLASAFAEAAASVDPRARAGAALGFALAGGRQRAALAIAGPLLEHDDPDVRVRALDVVEVLGPDAGLFLARVGALTEDPDATVRGTAAQALASLARAKR